MLRLILKILKFLIKNCLFIAILILCYIRYTQKVAEEGEPVCKCELCGSEVEIISTHWFTCSFRWLETQINE